VRKAILLVVTGPAIACGGDTPLKPLSELPHAAAVASCGPTDGPATMIYLASTPLELPQPSAPYIQVFVPTRYAESTPGKVYVIGEDFNEEASAWFNTSGVEPRQAVRGEVGVTALRANRLTGFVDLVFPNGVRMRGSFDASWHDFQQFCG
jgi:hypothetical protein